MLYLSGIILSFFLAFVLFTKSNKTTADIILMVWLTVTGLHLFTFYLYFTEQYLDYPFLAVLGFPLPLAQGPFLYLYTSQQTSSTPFDKRQLLHFLPVLLSYLLFAEFFFLSLEDQAEVFRQQGRGYETQTQTNFYAVLISGLVYVFLSLRQLFRYRRHIVHQFSNTDKINFNWLLYLIIWILAIWIIILIMRDDKLIFGAAALFVLWLGYFGIKQVQVFSQNTPMLPVEPAPADDASGISDEEMSSEPDSPAPDRTTGSSKYEKSSLSEDDAVLIHERLHHLMVEEKPFKNPDLTLNDLAKSLEVHPNHLSQVINSRENKNFYDLINKRRVEEFISLVAHDASSQYTLLGLAYDCGFNSKASFNRNFKKHMRLTPSDYVKSRMEGS